MSHRTIFLAAAALMFAATAFAHHNMSAIYDFNDKMSNDAVTQGFKVDGQIREFGHAGT